MNAALLKKTSIREGTSFGWVDPIGGVAHPKQLSLFAQLPCVPSHQPLTLLNLSSGPALPIFRHQKRALFVPTKTGPTNTSAIPGLFN